MCVAGVAVREDWAGLLLPGGKRRKEDGQARPKHVVIVKPINHDLTTVVF